MAIWGARVVVFAAFLDLFMQFPTAAPYAESLGASAAMIGVVVAAYSVTNLFGNLAAGRALDIWGRRLPIVVGLAVTSLAAMSYTLARSPEELILARAVHGVGAAVLAPGAFSIIGDRAPAGRWGHAMGMTGALIAAAALIGPPTAGIVRDLWGAKAVFALDSALLGAALLAFVVLTRSRAPALQSNGADSAARGRRRQLTSPALLSAYAAMFAIAVGVGALVAQAPLAVERLGRSGAESGYAFAAYALIALLAMATPLSRLGDRFGRGVPLALGLSVSGLALASMAFLPSYAGVLAGMGAFGLGYGLVFPAAAALVVGATDADRRGLAFGVFYAVYSLGAAVGASVSGLSLWGDDPGRALFAAGVVALAFAPLMAPCLLARARRSR